MMKKVFAVAGVGSASLFAAALLASGCSSTTIESGPLDASGGATRDRVVVETGPNTVATCYDLTPLNASKVKYNPPRFVPGACTDTEISAFTDFVKTRRTYPEVYDFLKKQGAACSACAFGDLEAQEWGPFFVENGKIVLENVSGCLQAVSASAECGKTYFQHYQCLLNVCATCEGDENDACISTPEVTTEACAMSNDAWHTACGNNLPAYIDECTKPDSWLAKQCSGSPSDAGLDAPSDG